VTYNQYEKSIEASRPIEVYQFTQGANLYNYTSAEDIITIDFVNYLPEPIKRTTIREGPENRKQVVALEVSAVNLFAVQYLTSVPGKTATCRIKRVQRSDFPTPEVVTLFDGKVRSIAFIDDGKAAKIALEPQAAATSRNIPRFTYMGMCNNVLYDQHCKVDENDPTFRHVGVVSGTSGNLITVTGASGFPDGFFNNGFVEFANGEDHRMVLDHTGDVLTLLLPFPASLNGQNVVVLAGCLHDPNDCHTKFFTSEDPTSNLINYGGYWSVPTNNPFVKGLL